MGLSQEIAMGPVEPDPMRRRIDLDFALQMAAGVIQHDVQRRPWRVLSANPFQERQEGQPILSTHGATGQRVALQAMYAEEPNNPPVICRWQIDRVRQLPLHAPQEPGFVRKRPPCRDPIHVGSLLRIHGDELRVEWRILTASTFKKSRSLRPPAGNAKSRKWKGN